MQIQSINSLQTKSKYNYQEKNSSCVNNSSRTAFKGFRGNGTALFVGDIDGTVALGAKTYLTPFLGLLEQCKARLVFASGRSLEKFGEMQANLAKENVKFPTPEFLITQNGSHIYQNVNGILMEDSQWSDRIVQFFDKEKILTSIKELAFQPEYLMPNAKISGVPDFSQSKLCTFEFWPTPRRLQFVADSSISDSIFRTIKDKLKKEGIPARVMKQVFSKEECDRTCNAEQRAIMAPRYDKNGFITQIDIIAANKGDGVKFIQSRLEIPDKEVVMAGNDANDISMAKLTLKDKTFIGVGNKTEPLERYMLNLIKENKELVNNLILPKQEGLAGIIEGINKIKTSS